MHVYATFSDRIWVFIMYTVYGLGSYLYVCMLCMHVYATFSDRIWVIIIESF